MNPSYSQGCAPLRLDGERTLHLMFDRAVRVDAIPRDNQLVVAIDSSVTDLHPLGLDAVARAALGDQLWVTSFELDDAAQQSEDLLLTAYLVSKLLDRRGPVALFAPSTSFVELLAAAVLLVRGSSQPAAIAAVRRVRPESFPEINDEIALAAIDEAHRVRERYSARRA